MFGTSTALLTSVTKNKNKQKCGKLNTLLDTDEHGKIKKALV